MVKFIYPAWGTTEVQYMSIARNPNIYYEKKFLIFENPS